MSGRHCTGGVESVMRSKSRGFIYSHFIVSLDRLYSALYFTVARSAEGRLPGRLAALSWVLRVRIPCAFLQPAGGSFRVENLNSSV